MQPDTGHTGMATPCPPMLALRPYQDEAVVAVRRMWVGGHRGAVIVLPTGTGKTLAALSQVARAHLAGHRVLWLAHRKELLDQPHRALGQLWPGAAAQSGVVQANRNAVDARIVFASMDTLRSPGRIGAFLDHGAPLLIVVDEMHHARAATWEATLGILDDATVAATGRRPYLLGLTATPERGDGKSLAGRWKIAYSYPLPRAIREGYLAPPSLRLEPLAVDLSSVRIHRASGDYDEAELEGALLEAGVVAHTVSAMSAHARGRRALVYCVTVRQAELTALALREAGFEARWLSGCTPARDRDRLVAAFTAGQIDALCNVMVLTEGSDLPCCDAIVVARPTRSKPLYLQILGRGLRLYPGKEDCLVLDLVGASSEHGLILAPVLLKELEEEEKRARTLEETQSGRRHTDWDPRARPRAAWVVVEGLDRRAWAVDCGEHGLVAMVEDEGGGWRTALFPRRGPLEPLVDGAVDLELALGLGEDVARKAAKLTRRNAQWRDRPATEAQLQLLARFRIQADEAGDGGALTRGAAGDLLTARFARRAIQLAGWAARRETLSVSAP